ncbi:MAG: hypothetical protein JRH01_26740 [Deltaproteobacteria bacterium]|nr:hypothetical protein [Deltaproteobacteria bacterium]MBW2396850.1 hypothetical protein [Deltaproteobacteria bacterium]
MLKANQLKPESTPMSLIHALGRPGRTTLPSAIGIPILVLALGFWLTDAWHARNHFKACQATCEAQGAEDSTFIAENQQHSRPAECRCGFREGEGLSWKRAAMPD